MVKTGGTDRFSLGDDCFLLDGKPFKIISGSIHYFRVVPEYWSDRLEKLRAMGCNTVETYVPWNLHESERGTFDFSGRLDIAAFIKLAEEHGLYAIIRPSPYICAEHEFGGLPWWLLESGPMRLRTNEGPFVEHVERYWKALFEVLAPLQISRGGNVVLFQLENEYGGFGNETAYLDSLYRAMFENGMEVPCITSDGSANSNLDNGALTNSHYGPPVLPTVNFGSKPDANLSELDALLSRRGLRGPRMVTEFWAGWFDSWGCGGHHSPPAHAQAETLDRILERGSVNIYVFHGGTNFGFMNGANYYDALASDVTSYDYGAPLSEDGSITEKYLAFRSVIAKHTGTMPSETKTNLDLTATPRRREYGDIPCNGRVSIFSTLDCLATPIRSPVPLAMEELGQGYGYTLYRTTLSDGAHEGKAQIKTMRLFGANDRAQVFLNGEHRATWYDRELLENHETNWNVPAPSTIDILMENMGRVNYGPYLESQRKGIAGCVRVNEHALNGWEQYCLKLDNTEKINWSGEYSSGLPALYRFAFIVDEPADTFLDTADWGKGCAILNGFNLGRFWSVGPQKRLYVPAPLLRAGDNELVIFETEGTVRDRVFFAGSPDLGPIIS